MIEYFRNIDFFWLYNSLYIIYILTVVGIIAVVVSENRSPVKSLAWVTVLILLPMLGIVLYLIFGRSIKNTRMISRRNRRRLRRKEDHARKTKISRLNLTTESKQLLQLGRTVSGAAFYTGNDVRIYTSGREKFDDLKKDLRTSKRFIEIQYYIIEDDNIGHEIRDILIERARSGVKVMMIYDHVGSFKVKSRFFKEMRNAGIEVYPFFKVVFPPFGTRINWRNHRKICVIDGEVGYIGGMNIADRYIDGGRKFDSWRDTHVRVTGPIVGGLMYSFAVDWNFMGQPLIEEEPAKTYSADVDRNGYVMQMLTSGPTSTWSNIAMLFIKAISSAKKRIFIQTPYFLPTEGLLKALQAAALSGVDVRLMIPRHSDSWMLTRASSSYIGECLQCGIKIYFYEAGMLHSKTMIVDDEFTSIGSTNFDFRSFEHNFEANIQIYSQAVNREMSEHYYRDIEKSSRVEASRWKKRNFFKKCAESATRLLSPIL